MKSTVKKEISREKDVEEKLKKKIERMCREADEQIELKKRRK